MSAAPPSPLATPDPWNAVADGYVTELVPLFERFAADALRLAAPPPRALIADLACGPGTVAFLAAGDAERVDALDFAPAMIDRLRAKAAAQGISNVHAFTGDGQSLPFADSTYDAAISLFGVIFYPDRARGLAEMWRVLKPGGRAVISSWAPMDRVPLLASVFKAMADESPAPQGGGGPMKMPLGDPADFRAELESAGFSSAVIHEVSQRGEAESIAAYWRSNVISSAPISLMQKRMGAEAFEAFSEKVLARLVAQHGTGPVAWDYVAYLGVGQK